ncbi:MAG: HAMP domain-containing protein [Synergistaceae bacterium]|nr:HAMP domain-containing protein [Synergistaceae bacterium]
MKISDPKRPERKRVEHAKYALKTKLSLHIAFVALLTVAVVAVLSHILINHHFGNYIARQQQRRTEEILTNVSRQYDAATESWNLEYLHAIGMYALYDGYIVRAYDLRGEMLWDAEVCDMNACTQMMGDISRKMRGYPHTEGSFTTKSFLLQREGREIGTVRISWFAPYFFSENDFLFLDALNTALVGSGVFSLALAVAAGFFLARRLSDPLRKTVDVTKRMSGGDYAVRLSEGSNIRELDELTLSVNHLARSIGAQESLRKQLTADVAHELRTPLTIVGTHIEAMMEGLWKPTRERLSSCYEEIERIGRLVFDMEKLAKVESENLKLDRTQVSLRELAEKTLRNFETEMSARGLRASVEGDCSEVSADRDRISQVLVNLVSNAVKYTQPGGTIRLALSETDETVRLDVEDDGIGISEEDLPFVFERFYRADKSRNRTTGGSGIGLAVVQSIVATHGGAVTVQSSPGEGSRFRVELPKRDAPQERAGCF